MMLLLYNVTFIFAVVDGHLIPILTIIRRSIFQMNNIDAALMDSANGRKREKYVAGLER